MTKYRYFFQKKKTNFTRQFFEKGLNISVGILFAIKESGELLLADLPNSYPGFRILKETFGAVPARKKEFNKQETRVGLARLEKQGLVAKNPKKKIYFLTDKGKELISYIEDRFAILKKPWDGNIRLVIFDIPEEKNYHRIWLREELLLLNFKELQKSVYIGKHPLPESFYKDMLRFGLNDFVFVFIVNNIDKRERVIKLLEE